MISNYSEENVRQIWDFMREQGLNDYAIAGLLGNIYAESRINPINLQNSCNTRLSMTDEQYTSAVDRGTYSLFAVDSAGYGLCQWTSSGRKQNLYNHCKLCGCSIGNLAMQLDFLWQELNGSYKSVLKVLQSAKTVSEAARVVMLKFERPADQSEAKQLLRVSYAEEFYTKYATRETEKECLVMKIAIDAGHGKYTSGKRCDKILDANQTREWVLNDRIADRLEALLEAYDCEVLRVDDTTGLTDVSLKNRVNKANNWGADVYISTHHNAGILRKLIGYLKKLAGGTVVYYYSSKAEREKQAQALYDAVVGLTGLVGDRASKVSKYPYYVLKNTKMPAFLIENGFMDSPTDVPIILSEDHANKTAQGLLNFLVSEFKLVKVKNTAATDAVATSFKVKVIVPELNYRAGAGTDHKVKGTIKDKGIYTIVETAKSDNGSTWGLLKSFQKQRNGWVNISSRYVSKI